MGLREAYHLPILILSPNTFRKKLMFMSDMCIIFVVERHLRLFVCFCLPLLGLLGTFGESPKPEGSTSPTLSLFFFAASNAFILSSLVYRDL